jgi:predicted metalloprotease with PDZ domain
MEKISKSFLLPLILFNFLIVYSQNEPNKSSYRYSIDLNEVKNHKLSVTLIPPAIESEDIIFRMPKMVPGTYHVYNFGRFVSDFTAYDKNGNKLNIEAVDSSSWKIFGARNLSKITYKVRETWEPENRYNFVFEPVGTNFDEGKNYVLNNNTLFGYFDDMKKLEYEIDITKPGNFYASTAMIPVFSDETHDKFVTPDYYELVDMPIMYTIPDTTVLKIGETDVLVSVYSVNKVITSKMLTRDIKSLLEAQKNYLGGNLPVKKYAYLVYYSDHSGSGAAGALEHNQSSLYFLIEGDTQNAKEGFKDAAAHEFFHIVTPLSIHSEEISDFDFANPKMSKHLWLYEGVTEYSAGIVQVKEGLMNRYQFLEWLKNKIYISGFFNDTLPFTEMSKNLLEKHEKQYVNVYIKGALIGMCLDLKLRSLSDGTYGIKNLLDDLSKKFGAEKPFKDDELFDIITEMTYPPIREFFRDYVEGPKPLPLKEIFELAGVKFIKSGKGKAFTLGNISIQIDNAHENVIITDTEGMNSFGEKMGYKKGDEIISINGKRLYPSKYSEFISELFASSKEGDELVMEVLRRNKDGKSKTVKLRAPMMKTEKDLVNNLEFNPQATQQQLKVREGWLGKN